MRGAGNHTRIRVVFCIDNMQIGGTELNAVRTAERLDRSRFDLAVACLQNATGPLLARYKEAGVPVFEYPITSLHSPRTLGAGLRFSKMLRDRETDVLHAHDVYSNIFGVPWARFARVRRVIASRRWWTAGQRKLQPLNRLAYRLSHDVLANSRSVGELLHQEGVPRDRIKIVWNFVDEDAFIPLEPAQYYDLLAEFDIPDTALIVGSVANLTPLKDHRTLLHAVAKLSCRPADMRVILIGDGPCRSELERLAGKLGLTDIVHFAGRRGNQPNLHHLFDVSILSSASEAFPNTVLEGMAAGNPVVASRVGGTADAVIDGKTGYLVPPSDPEAMAAAIDQLLRDPDLRGRFGNAGLRRAREQFGINSALESLEELYESARRAH